MLLWLKLAITPVLMTAATWAVRRWGAGVGGWIIGLPLTSGPISLFLLLERGPAFAAHAAVFTLLGINGVTACVTTYAHAATRWSWPATAAASVLAYGIITAALRQLTVSAPVAFAGSVAFAALASWTLPPPRPFATGRMPAWDLPARIAAAMAMVLLITALAERLGPTWSGLLSPFPVFTLVMAVFSHRHVGGAVATSYARGLLASSVGFAGFFLVVALTVQASGTRAFAFATLAALGGGGLAAVVGRGQRPRPESGA